MIDSLKSIRLSLILVSFLSVAPVVFAENVVAKGPASFSSYDVNNDGFVSETEFYELRDTRKAQRANQGRAMRKAGDAPNFESFDSNKDGKLTKLELLEGQNEQMKKNRSNRASQMGNNQRGKPSGMRGYRPTFQDFDLNDDGYLTENEMLEVRAKRQKEKASQGKMLRNSANASKFSDIDLNNDGKVSKQEFISNRMGKR